MLTAFKNSLIAVVSYLAGAALLGVTIASQMWYPPSILLPLGRHAIDILFNSVFYVGFSTAIIVGVLYGAKAFINESRILGGFLVVLGAGVAFIFLTILMYDGLLLRYLLRWLSR